MCTLANLLSDHLRCSLIFNDDESYKTMSSFSQFKFELIPENVSFPLDLVISHQITFLPRH